MNLFIRIAILMTAVLGMSAARADVSIVDNSVTHYAVGEMRAAAIAGAENAYIYCDISGSIIGCGAADGHGMFASCWSDDARSKQLFASIGRTATLTFFIDPRTGRCAEIEVQNSSLPFSTLSPDAPHFAAAPVVDLVNGYAYGSMNSLTASGPDDVSCTSGDTWVSCSIIDGNGVEASCFSSGDSPGQSLDDMRLAIAGVNESSYVFFRWEGESGNPCLDLYVSNGSWYLQ